MWMGANHKDFLSILDCSRYTRVRQENCLVLSDEEIFESFPQH